MFKTLTTEEAQQKIAAEKVNIVDIRDINSYLQGHIEGAEHLTAENFGEFCDENDKSLPLLVYCYHGVSSQAAAQHFLAEGFTDVYSMTGGFAEWKLKHSFVHE
jgi:thiosulfate sulfurtransferase